MGSERHQPAKVTGYTYDAAGDMTADGLGNTYQYNAEGMLVASNNAQYVYDAFNQRVEQTVSCGSAEFIYFQGRMVAGYTPSTATWTDGIWAKGKMIVLVPGTQTGGPEYRLLDHLGSLVIGTTSSGSVYDSDSYLPFGQLTASSTADPLLYTGIEKDAENNSYHAWFRNLSIAQARWLRPDPYLGSYNLANPQSFNRYAYVGNNPLAFIDPSGYIAADGTSDECPSPEGCAPPDQGCSQGGNCMPGGGTCLGDSCVTGTPPTTPDPSTSQPPDPPPAPPPSSACSTGWSCQGPSASNPSPGPGTGNAGGGGGSGQNSPSKTNPAPPPTNPQGQQNSGFSQKTCFYLDFGSGYLCLLGGATLFQSEAFVVSGPLGLVASATWVIAKIGGC